VISFPKTKNRYKLSGYFAFDYAGCSTFILNALEINIPVASRSVYFIKVLSGRIISSIMAGKYSCTE